MKITKRQLKRIIREEKKKLLSEAPVIGTPDATMDLDMALMKVMKQLLDEVGYTYEEAQEAVISYVTEKISGM
jgi:uncharacterized protein (DUF2267 family)